jgi:fatty acid desaturase
VIVPTELREGEEIGVPPFDSRYQVIPVVEVNALLAFKVWIGLVSHWVMLPLLVGAAGAAVIVSITGVRNTLEQVPLKYWA